jgi:hypothetical protein
MKGNRKVFVVKITLGRLDYDYSEGGYLNKLYQRLVTC